MLEIRIGSIAGTIMLAIAAILLIILGVLSWPLVEGYRRRRKIMIARAILLHELDEIRKRYSALFEMGQILTSHSSRYFLSLNEAGLDKLIRIIECLGAAVHDCESLIELNHFGDAKRLIKFLQRSDCAGLPELKHELTTDLNIVKNWEIVTNDLLFNCTSMLNESSASSKKLGIIRHGSRRKTYYTLDLLRQMLSEETQH